MRSGICHYCGEAATTKDHIVARFWYRGRTLPQFVAESNKVPACADCNNRKDWFRTDCGCPLCIMAWELMSPYILPKHKRDIPLMTVKVIVGEENTA